MRYSVNINGKNFDVEIKRIDGDFVAPTPVETPRIVPVESAPVIPKPVPVVSETSNLEIVSPMPGAVLKILTDVGQQVSEGQAILILEAMKMEIEVNAPKSGTIKQVLVNIGSSVGANDVLIVMN